mgnify:CR=1 FL=1
MKASTGRKFFPPSPCTHVQNQVFVTQLHFVSQVHYIQRQSTLSRVDRRGRWIRRNPQHPRRRLGGMGTTSEKDGKFVAQLHKLFGTLSKNEGKEGGDGGHKHFVTPKFGKDLQFLILHYAGQVRCRLATNSSFILVSHLKRPLYG